MYRPSFFRFVGSSSRHASIPTSTSSFLSPAPPPSPSLPYKLLHKVGLSHGLDLWASRFSSIFELARMKFARNLSITSAGHMILQNEEGSSSRRVRDPFQAPTCCAPALPIVLPRCSFQSGPALFPDRKRQSPIPSSGVYNTYIYIYMLYKGKSYEVISRFTIRELLLSL